ncbi:hypothetical protein A3860_13280 [Niastella vici]|uniref:Uncharacterized protein n=1 Tax=Niastella vici TaxID=1703345 RepID=A0A1V9G7K2_9BACT|nr:hypothetical protein [Niastella vici]OQP66458.1 hypothetical protein A3860_13280 [Niastella vici]
MKRPWLYYISPITILAGLSFILLIVGFVELVETEIYFFVFFSALVFGGATLVLTAIGYAVRFATNGKVLYIWIIEAAILAIPVIGYLMCRQGY